MRSQSKRAASFETNLIVWVHLEGFPWWPARVVDRKKHEETVELGEYEELPKPNGHNSMVEWFDEDKCVSVLDNDHICEYTNNMKLLLESGKPKDVVEGCERANAYLDSNTNVVASQVERYRTLQPFDEFINGAPLNSKKNSSKAALPDTGSENPKGKGKKRDASAKSRKKASIPRKKKSSSSNKPHKKSSKRDEERSLSPINDNIDSDVKESRNSHRLRENSPPNTTLEPKHDTSGDEAEFEYANKSGKRPADQSRWGGDAADPDQSPSARTTEPLDKEDSGEIESNDDQDMRGKRRKTTSPDSQREGSDGYESRENDSKRRKIHQDSVIHSDEMDIRSDEDQQKRYSDSDSDDMYHKSFSNPRDRERQEQQDLNSRRSHMSNSSYSSNSSGSERGGERRTHSRLEYDEPDSDFDVGPVDRNLARGNNRVPPVPMDVLGTRGQEMGFEDASSNEMNKKFETFQVELMEYNDILLEAEYLRELYEKRLIAAGIRRERLVSFVQDLKSVKVTAEMLDDTKVHERMNSYVEGMKDRAPEFVKDMVSLADQWGEVDGLESPEIMDSEPSAGKQIEAKPKGGNEDAEMKITDEVEDEGAVFESKQTSNPGIRESKVPEGTVSTEKNKKETEKEKEKEPEGEDKKKQLEGDVNKKQLEGDVNKKQLEGDDKRKDIGGGDKEKEPQGEDKKKQLEGDNKKKDLGGEDKEEEPEREEKLRPVKELLEGSSTAEVGQKLKCEDGEKDLEDSKKSVAGSHVKIDTAGSLQDIRDGPSIRTEERAKRFDSSALMKSLKVFLARAGGYNESQRDEMTKLIEKEISKRSKPNDPNSFYTNSVNVIKKLKRDSSLVDQLFRTQDAQHFFD